MKKWNDVREEACKKFLDGNKRIEMGIYQLIDKELHSLSMVQAVLVNYPEDTNATIGDDLTISSDLKLVASIRKRMVFIITRKAECKFPQVEHSKLQSFIAEWILCNWPTVVNNYRDLLEKKLSLILR